MNRLRHAVACTIFALEALVLAGSGPAPASAANIVVDTLADAADPPFAGNDLCGTGTVADLPGADAHISLREAISAANHTPGPHTITFAPALSGGMLSVSFDNLDADSMPNLLPFLCGGGLTIDGDIDGDGTPDITVNGSAALPTFAGGLTILSSHNTVNGLSLQNFPAASIVVFHPFFQSDEPVADRNVLTNNHVRGGTFPIIIQASGNDLTLPGHVSNTNVTGNTVSEATLDGILVLTGDGAGSSITGTSITDNSVLDNGRFGILVTTNLTKAGTNGSITATTVTTNEVAGNGSTGIATLSFAGTHCTISGLLIDSNDVHNNGFGISGGGGACGGSQNSMELTITRNTLDTSGILIDGGTNILCGNGPLPSASGNTVTATVNGNILRDGSGAGILVIGGEVSADDNSVTATVADNTVTGLAGITVIGGLGISGADSGPADHNQVTATVRDNRVGQSFAGIATAGGASGQASDNAVNVTVEHNVACSSSIVAIQCEGGLPSNLGLQPNEGTGNTVTGTIGGNFATSVVADNGVTGNTCNVQQPFNAPCLRGDASCNGQVTAADIPALLLLIAAGDRAFCGLDDANDDGHLDAADLRPTITAVFSG